MMRASALTPESLLPHRSPMVLLDAVEEVDDESAACTVIVRGNDPFVEMGAVPAMATVEWVAQTVGVHVGYRCTRNGEPIRVGYLIGVRDASFATYSIAVGTRVRVEVRRILGDHDLATYDGTVVTGGVELARISVNVYREAT